jgi:hypothetical protein
MSVYHVPDMVVKMSNPCTFSMLSIVIAVHLQYNSSHGAHPEETKLLAMKLARRCQRGPFAFSMQTR